MTGYVTITLEVNDDLLNDTELYEALTEQGWQRLEDRLNDSLMYGQAVLIDVVAGVPGD